MLRIFHNTTYDFVRWWRWAAGLTIAFILAGLASFAVKGGVNYSIEFTSGTLVEVHFKQPPSAEQVRASLDKGGIVGAEITQFGSDTVYTIRARDEAQIQQQGRAGAEKVANRIQAALASQFPAGSFSVQRTEVVGPKVGDELRRGAFIALLLGSLITLVYLAFRFEWRFGVAAVLSSAHDVLVTLAFLKLTHMEVSLTVVAGILTLLGYSMNDTIIIFDRVRENFRKNRKEPLRDLLNRSINETLPRSVLTHVTVLAATLALLLFSSEVLRPFAWVMSFGIVVATFSSIYVASPLLLWIETKWPRKTDAKGSVGPRSGSTPAAPTRPRAGRTEPVGAR